MNYIPNPNASGWRVYIKRLRQKMGDYGRYLAHKIYSNNRFSHINNRVNRLFVLTIGTVMLLSTLFSISLIIVFGFTLFIISGGWQSLTGLFRSLARQRPL